MKRSFWALGLFVLIGGCATSDRHSSASEAYWDLPETGSYWVPVGVDAREIVEAARICGAQVDGGIDHHVPVPPGYAFHVFHFVGENSPAVQACTVDHLGAVPRLTARLKRTL